MSNFEAQQWQPSADLAYHRANFEQAVSHVEDQSYMYPDDGRMHTAQALLSMRGKGTSVHVTGTAGAGKTFAGDVMVGEENRVTIEPTDTNESLTGFRNPIDADQMIPGRVQTDAEDPRFYFNEIAQLRNTGPLHAFWDGEFVVVNGQQLPLRDALWYATSNFPDDRRNHAMDGAMKSRQAVEILAGDTSREHNARIHGRDLGVLGGSVRDTRGVVPGAETSRSLRETLGNLYPLDSEYELFVADALEAIEGNRLLSIIDSNKADSRLSEGWQQTVRAMRLAKRHTGVVDSIEITGELLPVNNWAATVASALVLPTQVELSQQGRAHLRDLLDVPVVRPLEEAIALRHALAAVCFNLYVSKLIDPASSSDIAKNYKNFMANYTFANPNGIKPAIDEFSRSALAFAQRTGTATNSPNAQQPTGDRNGNASNRRFFSRTRSR